MYQQINLYQPVFRRQRKVLSALTLLQVLVVAAVVLLVFFLQARWTLGGLDSTAVSLSNQYQQLEARLGILENTGDLARASVKSEAERLQSTIDERRTLLERFSRLTIRDSNGFAEFFETLARRSIPGLWLTGIVLTEEGETEIRGSTLDPTLVPRYLQDMPEEPRFIALHQGSVHLSRDDPSNPHVNFVLKSTPEAL
jgi:Tfp pilus assembly protein PilN